MKRSAFVRLALVRGCVIGCMQAGGLYAATVDLQPVGKVESKTVDGVRAWESPDQMSFAAPADMLKPGTTGRRYAKIVYLDRGKGLLEIFYQTAGGMYRSTVHTRSSRVNTGEWVESYHELPAAAAEVSGTEEFLGITVLDSDGAPLTVRSVTVQDTPFADAAFIEAVAKPWKQALHFTAPDSPPANTLKGQIMVGYQGWFRAPNDRDDDGWFHWFRSQTDPNPAFYTFDMWPDTSGYDAADRVRAGSTETRGGQPAWLFSSTSEGVVRQHFRWMREYGIDGAFLQRFLSARKGGDDGTPEWVLMNVRKAANAEKRLWAVEYDVSGMPTETALEALRRDWSWLHDVLKVTDDPYYAREGGRPVVFIWGLPFPDRNITASVSNEIVDFFKDDPKDGGNYVIGSLPNEWAHLSPAWLAHAGKYDAVQVWQSHDYATDMELCKKLGITSMPHVWPGFSWAHLMRKQEPAAFTDRAGGTFFRDRIAQALAAGCDRLFVGMFDEYDEGTAIMPMSSDPPPPGPPAGRFLTNGKDASDLWMRIAGEAGAALKAPSPAQAFKR